MALTSFDLLHCYHLFFVFVFVDATEASVTQELIDFQFAGENARHRVREDTVGGEAALLLFRQLEGLSEQEVLVLEGAGHAKIHLNNNNNNNDSHI